MDNPSKFCCLFLFYLFSIGLNSETKKLKDLYIAIATGIIVITVKIINIFILVFSYILNFFILFNRRLFIQCIHISIRRSIATYVDCYAEALNQYMRTDFSLSEAPVTRD